MRNIFLIILGLSFLTATEVLAVSNAPVEAPPSKVIVKPKEICDPSEMKQKLSVPSLI